MDNEDITIYGGTPGETARFLEEFVLHGTITGRMPSDDQGVRPVPALVQPWVHGVPPMRPAENRGTRHPSAGGRRFDEIFLAESESYAGEVDLHFERRAGIGDIISLTMTDFLNLQAAVTDPAKPVTRRQVREYLRGLLGSGPPAHGSDPAAADALHGVLALLGED